MRLFVSSLWDDEFAQEATKHNVAEIYASFRMSLLGSGRPACVLPPEDSMEHVEKHIKLVHSLGVEFDYVANPICLGNMEYDDKKRKEILEFFDMLDNMGVRIVTIGVPILIEVVKKNFPKFKIRSSEVCHVTNPRRAQFYEEQGVDSITISFMSNRDFETLRAIRKAVKCELVVVLSNCCLFQCPNNNYHLQTSAHAGQVDNPLKGFMMDYALFNCVRRKLLHPEEYIRSPWIRPEDVEVYEKIGIEGFKLANRQQSKEIGLKATKAYVNRHYNGNWLDIVTPVSLKQTFKPRLEGFSEEEWREVAKLWSVPEPDLYLDNRDLDGFIEFFTDNKCSKNCGIDCNYCDNIAKKFVKLRDTKSYVAILDQIISIATDFETPLKLPEEGKMVWSEKNEKLLESQLPSIPKIFRDTATKSIRGKAEHFATERNSKYVEEEDVVRACLRIAPKPFLPQVIKSLKKEGVDVDKYQGIKSK